MIVDSSKNFPPSLLSIASSNNKSPDPPPVTVPTSNSIWESILPDSGANPPLTTETFASAVPELNVSVSPSSKFSPTESTITSDTPAPDISNTWILAPDPPPPVKVASSPTVNVLPLFVITAVDKHSDTVAPIVTSGSALLIPVISAPLIKVPVVVSVLSMISIICVLPSWNFKTFSTIAVALFIIVDEGLFACVIVCPVRKIGSLTDCSDVWVQRINVWTFQEPPDTLNISSDGV